MNPNNLASLSLISICSLLKVKCILQVFDSLIRRPFALNHSEHPANVSCVNSRNIISNVKEIVSSANIALVVNMQDGRSFIAIRKSNGVTEVR